MTTDALQKAKELIEDAWVVDEGDLAEQLKRQDAAIYAAIAQAEQLKRIADLMEIERDFRIRRGDYGYADQ